MQIYEAQDQLKTYAKGEVLSTNQILARTYFLLSLTLLFSALTTVLTLVGIFPMINSGILFLLGTFGLLFAAQATSRTKWGLFWVFAFTGFTGWGMIAPVIAYTFMQYSNAASLVFMTLIGTITILVSLSVYALISKKDFSYLNSLLVISLMAVLILSVISIFSGWTLGSLIVSSAMIVISAGSILVYTSALVRKGEQNYILVTISLYVAILNLFLSLLRILSIFAGRRS